MRYHAGIEVFSGKIGGFVPIFVPVLGGTVPVCITGIPYFKERVIP